ncbi:MAG TPA: ABC transporter permease [Kofleriaceae bacterium]|nr:ABC transporter permease [Kofleriaceae bacterium]
MMPPVKLVRLVGANAWRNRRQFVLSAIGIIAGIAAFVFFLSLALRARSVILEAFPLERVEVVAPRASVLGMNMTKPIDDAMVKAMRARPEVTRAVPRMALMFPATGEGWFEGNRLAFELGGFADGIDPSFIDNPEDAALFRDWESPEARAAQKPCGPAPEYACPSPDTYYCKVADGRCHHRVPVLISPTLIELYNAQFAPSHGLPVIDGTLKKLILERGGLGAMWIYIGLGDTMVSGSNTNLKAPPRKVQGVLIGLSDKAMPLGMTVPIQYVRRWNREFAGEKAAANYSSVEVMLRDQDDVAPFAQWLKEDLSLELKDSLGEDFANVVFFITLLFMVISAVIVTISAINIAHNFFMQVSERRREIGLLRALGATRGDIRGLFLVEAALIGIVGGGLGIAVAYAGGLAADWAADKWVPNFAFRPDSFFDFHPIILACGLGFAVVFCVIGGLLPARKAARMEPARALSDR